MKKYKKILVILPEDISHREIYNQTIFLKKGLLRFMISKKDISTDGKFIKLEMCIEHKGDEFIKKTVYVNNDELFNIFHIVLEDNNYLIKFSNEKFINEKTEEDITILKSQYFDAKLNFLWTDFSNTHDLICLLIKMITNNIKKEDSDFFYNKLLYLGYPSFEDIIEIYNSHYDKKDIFNKIINEITYTEQSIIMKIYTLFVLIYISEYSSSYILFKYNYLEIAKIKEIANSELKKYLKRKGF